MEMQRCGSCVLPDGLKQRVCRSVAVNTDPRQLTNQVKVQRVHFLSLLAFKSFKVSEVSELLILEAVLRGFGTFFNIVMCNHLRYVYSLTLIFSFLLIL